MNSDGLATVAIAALCVLAIGTASTTLESSLSTDPDEVIDPDYERLPFDSDDVRDVREEAGDGDDNEATVGGDGDGDDGGGDGESGGGGSDTGGTGGGGESTANQSESGPFVPPPDLLDRLLALLRELLPLVLLAGLLAVGAALAYRHADRLLALLAALSPSDANDPERDDGDDWPPGEPSNEVATAWLAMVRSLDVERLRSKTPAECAAVAREAGMNPDAVDALTRTFEEVQYGGAPITAERRRRVRRGLRTLSAGQRGGPT